MLPPFRDPSLPPDRRADDLLSRMTLYEKAGQLNQRLLGWTAWRLRGEDIVTTPALDEELDRWGGVGAVYGLQRADAWSGRDWSDGARPDRSAEVAQLVQSRIRERSRFGIPALFVEEAPHGHQALGSTLLPVNLAAGFSWDPALLEEATRGVARELRARGVHLALVSGLDVLRDPRWGRSEEMFGEDPLLAAMFTRAQVRGMQSVAGIGVVLKHLAGQGAAIGGRNSSGAPLGPRELREIHLVAGRAGVEEGAVGVMAAYNDVDGVPCIADESLLTGVLREQWGFEGIVMADMFAIDRLLRAAPSHAHAAAIALRAGVDLSMCDVSYGSLVDAVENGLASEGDIDRACRRLLLLKFRLGLFDDAPVDAPASFDAASTRASARELAGRTPVLLKNRGAVLPLAPSVRVALVGPNADDVGALLGDYVPPLAAGDGVSVRRGLAESLSVPPRFAAGAARTAALAGGTDEARRVASDADVVVLVVGSTSARAYDDDFEANGAGSLGRVDAAEATTGEGYDVAEVRLPAAQRELAAAVSASGVPLVSVVVSGRPHGLTEIAALSDAVLVVPYPGPEGGRAIADVLLGRVEPTGRLSVSLPHSSGTLPVAYNERMENTVRYIDAEATSMFPFGSGMGWCSWTVETVSSVPLRPGVVRAADLPGIGLTSRVHHDGSARASTVVQLYGRARLPGLLPRKAVLLGFGHVTADPGETVPIRVMIERDALDGLGVERAGVLDLWLSTNGPAGWTTDHSLEVAP